MIFIRTFLLFLIFFSSSSLLSQLRIEIRSGLEEPLRIAVVPIEWGIDSPPNHYVHEVIKKDLELYLPKLKQNGWIGGHDYNKKYWPGVIQAVNETLGIPEHTFKDFSWLSKNKRTKLI